jgi:hypothetical protein
VKDVKRIRELVRHFHAPFADSDLFRPGIPTGSRPLFRFEAGHHSKMKPAGIPINFRPGF